MRTFSVKNFERFQHYTDRSPPWIKLYNALLDNYAFACLQDASKLHLIMIWLVASRTGNKIPYDAEWISGRINASETVDLDALLKAGFIQLNEELPSPEQVASAPLAKRLPRERVETEGEKEAAALSARPALGIIRRFDDLAAATFGEHLRRAFPDSTDLVIADRWLAAGAGTALCEAVFSALMGRMKARGQGPPKSLKYFDQAVSDALAAANSPMPEGHANGRKSGRLSATEGLYAGFALALGQHEPEDDRGTDSHAAEPLLDGGHAARAAPTPKRGLAS